MSNDPTDGRMTNPDGVVELLTRAAVAASPGAATCGECGRVWDDDVPSGLTPAPSGRCPFECEHGDGEISPA